VTTKNDSTTEIIGNIRVGHAETSPTMPTHVPGVLQGNHAHRVRHPDGMSDETVDYAKGTARRSTGIRPDSHTSIDPRMPKLSPA
jgi:hypothetical protein